ncbi:MAG: glycosyltransferase family 4 protein, partial [Candidatus Roizmanbacteria bacterium]|nr:glycosyltransferase family 4 protein [Candidatus Roizmanbacteria bacterium]
LEKGIERLLTIWSHVVKKLPDATLLLIGGAGSYQKTIDQQIAHYKLSPHVVCIGPIEHRKLLSSGLLSVLDVFVSTSTTETFGLSMVESMAHGVPVVIPRTQGMKDVVGSAGLISSTDTEMADAIVRMFTNEPLRIQFGTKAQQVASRYSGEAGIDSYMTEFQKVIRKLKRRSR